MILLLLCCQAAAPCLGAQKDRAAGQAVQSQALAGNAKSRVYHNSRCRYFTCKNCVVRFADAREARQQGYRPCKLCGG